MNPRSISSTYHPVFFCCLFIQLLHISSQAAMTSSSRWKFHLLISVLFPEFFFFFSTSPCPPIGARVAVKPQHTITNGKRDPHRSNQDNAPPVNLVHAITLLHATYPTTHRNPPQSHLEVNPPSSRFADATERPDRLPRHLDGDPQLDSECISFSLSNRHF